MIHYLEHNAIDRSKWDALVSEGGLIYAQSWYLDIVHPDWEALVLGDYEAIMPITGGMKFGVRYLFQPFFVQQLGVISRDALSAETLLGFLNAIPKKFRFAEIKLNEKNVLDGDVQGIDHHRNIILDLNHDYNIIHANYHNNTKRNLVKSEQLDLQVIEMCNLMQIIKLFREHRGATVGVWGDEEYATLSRLGEVAMKRGAAFTVGVTEKGSEALLCGALFMKTADRVVFLFSGNSDKGKETQAMTFMLDAMIQRFANQPVLLDFEGSDDPNLARYYLGFGGEERRYPSYTFNAMSAAGKALLRLWKGWK